MEKNTMPEYRVNFGVTYYVEAQDEEAAWETAYDLVLADYGLPFAKDSWIDVEEID